MVDPQNQPSGQEAPLPFAPFAVEELAPLFPGLHIERLIAVGGMGAVYLAKQVNLDRPVALKILPPAKGLEGDTAARFAHEARLMAQLHHPNIVAIYDFGQSGGLFFFIMEYVNGATFHSLIENKQIDASHATPLMIQICSGVSYAHQRGVLHHDLKPGNLMLNSEHKAKLLDFGLAGIFKPGHRDATAAAWGTADYVAPERLTPDAPIDHRADIYSLGVIYYEILTGTVPRQGYELPSKIVPGVHPQTDEIIKKVLAQNPANRYSNVSDFELDLKKLNKKPKVKSIKTKPSLKPAGSVSRKPAAGSTLPKRKKSLATKATNTKPVVSAVSAGKSLQTAKTSSRPKKKRRPVEDEATLAARMEAQAQWEERNKADKKKREMMLTLTLLIGGTIAILVLILIMAGG